MFGLFRLISVGLRGRSRGRGGHGFRHQFGEGKGHGGGKGRGRKRLENTAEHPAVCREFSFLRPALPETRPLSIDQQTRATSSRMLSSREQPLLTGAQPVSSNAGGEMTNCPLCENHCSLDSPSCKEGSAFAARQRRAPQRSL